MVAPTPQTASEEAARLIEQAAKVLCREARQHAEDYPGDPFNGDPMTEALNEVRAMLDDLARRLGYRLDFAEEQRSAISVEYVSEQEYADRPEVAWFSFAKTASLIGDDLEPDDALAIIERYRRAVRERGLFGREAAS